MLELVIPTLYKSPNLSKMLPQYLDHLSVWKVHIIDNGRGWSYKFPDLVNHPKISVYTPEVYNEWKVNPAWNLGVSKCSDSSIVGVLNDDIVFPIDIFDFILSNSENMGILGMHDTNYKTTEKSYEIVDIPHHCMGWGCAFFFNKTNWVPIPSELKVFYGDTFIFHEVGVRCKALKGVPMSAANISSTVTASDLIEEAMQHYLNDQKWFTENCGTDLNKDNMRVETLYEEKCKEVSDIYYHLPKLRELASQSNHVTEFGVRGGVSTIALLAGNPKTMVSYDIHPCPQFLYSLNDNVDFSFIQNNVLNVTIEPTDFLFIDTLHNYDQLTEELRLHSSKVRKWIAFHDTHTYGNVGENYEGKTLKGLLPALNEFLETNPSWKQVYQTQENNGLTVIERAS